MSTKLCLYSGHAVPSASDAPPQLATLQASKTSAVAN